MKTILFDMDEVLVGLLDAWLNWLNDKHNLNVQRNEVTNWDMRPAYPSLSDAELYAPLHLEEFWKSVCPLPYARAYLEELHKAGHKIKVVTASHYNTLGPKIKNALLPYFSFLSFKDVICTYDKGMIKGDILVDDYVENLRHFNGVTLLMDTPYNQDVDPTLFDFRVHNLKEVYDIICQLEIAEMIRGDEDIDE